MYKPGAIRKIQVKNFVTYNYVEMFPGPKLNMIIGPNGTGKSTMVAAIILGLGGNPRVVGRGTKISEYVKHNCDHSTINIFLQDEREDTVIKITREFDTQDRTSWKINDRRCSAADMEECIQRFSIQVNNLCQFLPQDRVQDFAKLNTQDLLKQTQVALCRDDLIQKQDMLIESRSRHKELLRMYERYVQNLQEARDANVRLEGRVKNFQKKLKYKEKIGHIDRKIAWTVYEEMRGKLAEVKKDRSTAQQVYDKFKNASKPMEQEISLHKRKISEMQQKNSSVSQKIRNSESAVTTITEKIETLNTTVRTIKDDIETKLAEIEQWDKEIESAVKKLEDMQKLHAEIKNKCNQGHRERNVIIEETNNLKTHLASLREKKEQLDQSLQATTSELRALENELQRLENVKQQRFEKLQRLDHDAYRAVLWLRNNKHLFDHEIFEPIMMEINVLDISKAVYVENCISIRERLAFTCVDKNDMNKLIRCLRVEQGLSVNILHSGSSEGMNQFQPEIPIEHLRQYGFYTYVNCLFSAPDPIMRYLCKNYRLHNIPVGDANTNNFYEQLPKSINNFFSDKCRFSISYSKYTGEKSIRQSEIRADGGLSLSLDVVRVEQLRGRSDELKRQVGNHDKQVENYNSQMQRISQKLSSLKDKLKEIEKERQHAEAVESRIRVAQRNLNEMRNNKRSPEEVRQEGQRKTQKYIGTMSALQENLKKELENIVKFSTESGLNSLKIEDMRQKMAYVENKIVETRQRCREAEETLNAINEKYNSIMGDAKRQLATGKELSGGFTPADEGFAPFREMFDSLSADMQELNADKEMLLSRIDCLNTADDGEIKEYEDRVKLIENLQEDIEKTNTQINTLTAKMDRLQEEWLGPLNELVANINYKFAAAFERMGCAGEVSISPGDNEKDFAQYGLSIKVTYRNGEPLQELNATVQSGGERAVATAAFMLSLQELTPVPFRCVDEINQGMDANNERRIFELIVECTCQEDTAQYFLITPKLVPKLTYHRDMRIHIVHNGPMVVQDKKWGFSKLCNPDSVELH